MKHRGCLCMCVRGTQCGGTPRAQQEMPVVLAAVSGWVAVWLGYGLVRVLE